MDQPSSVGKQVALAGLSATQAVTLLLYVCNKLGMDDMTPEVAGAIIGVAVAAAGGIMHDVQRRRERKDRERKAALKAMEGGPA